MNPEIRKSVLQIAILLSVFFALGIWPSWIFQGSAGIYALCWAKVICGSAALLSLIPLGLLKSTQQPFSRIVQAYMLGTIIRLFFTLIGAIVVYMIFVPLKGWFALWLVIDYIVLLIWDTLIFLRLLPQQKGKSALV